MSQHSGTSKSLVEKYGQLLRLDGAGTGDERRAGLEGPSKTAGPGIEMTERGIKDYVERIHARLKKFAEKYYGNEAAEESDKQIDAICESISVGLALLRNKDEEGLKRNPKAVSGLEEVIIGDGSRPMYMIENNRVDTQSAIGLESQNGNPIWEGYIESAMEYEGLVEMIPSVGLLRSRVAPLRLYGTAFLVAPDLIMTNRHVWNQIANNHQGRYNEVCVDFQYESSHRSENRIRRLDKLEFLGADRARPEVDVDVALISLTGQSAFHQTPFEIYSSEWRNSDERSLLVFVIGHPKIPTNRTQLERFLSGTSYVKRLCPGASVHEKSGEPILHDASTTVTCSGAVLIPVEPSSLIPVKTSSKKALGIHFGGEDIQPNVMANKAHAFCDILDEESTAESPAQSGTLRQILSDFGAGFRDSDL
jgi:hypothetical protein